MTRLLFVTILARVAQLALGQSVVYPTCAQDCLDVVSYATDAGCQFSDGYCLCMSPNYIRDLACCMASSCEDASDLQTSFDLAEYVCSSTYQVIVTIDPSPTCDPDTTSTTTETSPTATSTDSIFSDDGGSGTGSKTKKKKKGGSKKKFGTGAIAGVAVAAVVIIAVIVIAVIFILKRRNDKKKAAASHIPPQTAPFLAVGGGYPNQPGQQQQQQPEAFPAPPQYTPQAQEKPQGAVTYAQYGVSQSPTLQPPVVSPMVPHPNVPEIQGAEVYQQQQQAFRRPNRLCRRPRLLLLRRFIRSRGIIVQSFLGRGQRRDRLKHRKEETFFLRIRSLV